MPLGDEHSTHTINEHTQGESHPHQTNNTLDDNNTSHVHQHEGQMTRRHHFVNRIMEVDLPLGWKLISQEHYNRTTYLEERLDAFLT